ncbi:MAG: hypothetical protein JO316_24850 [Abitibacteriaceae bacterium]|nr:hypothetical protein [Abditibacteriaceae bacterium]
MPNHRWQQWGRTYAAVAAAYVLLTACTDAFFFGDTADYTVSILTGQEFWDFGHLLWRPLGWLCYHLFGSFTRPIAGPYERPNITLILLLLNWLAGLGSVLLLYNLITRVCASRWVAYAVTLFFICSQAFLNFTQTGSSYIVALFFLLLGFYLLVCSGQQAEHALGLSVGAGIALAGAVCFWLPYIFAIPAALATPLFFYSFSRTQWRPVTLATISLILTTATAYLIVIFLLRLHSLADIRTWMAASSHGITAAKGPLRMIFGFARSFINMGNDGVLFKRFVLHDPLNPVPLQSLVRLSLWKLVLFYVFLGSLVLSLLHSARGKQLLKFFALNAGLVIIFAIAWQGGDMERYLALYPTLFLVLGYSLDNRQAPNWFKGVALLFMAVATLTNLSVMAKPVLKQQEKATEARIWPLQPLVRSINLVYVIHAQDELFNFSRSYPFNPLNSASHIHIRALVESSTDTVAQWRGNFAVSVLAVWQRGGNIWISKRLLTPRPRPEWNWVEGNDKEVSWKDLYFFFSRLDKSEAVGGADGFVLVPASPHNQQLLRPLAHVKGLKAPYI